MRNFRNRILKTDQRWVPDFRVVEGTQEEREKGTGEINQMTLILDFLNSESSRTFRKRVPKTE